jgi:leucyl/phenylalanyl-tRNA--protein transferase
MPIPRLGADPRAPFPPLARALREPDGLLAVGGDLSPERLLAAYRHGAFPWFNPGDPILWWSPDPRVVFETARFRLPRKLRARLPALGWTLRADTDFEGVVARCANIPRRGERGTWIGPEMQAAYARLHRLGHAHSIEVYAGTELVGGIYGVAIGRMFFGESMFSARPDGSRVALAGLARLLAGWDWPWIDAQVENPHLRLLGAVPVPRPEFAARVAALCALDGRPGSWRDPVGERPADWPREAPGSG